MYLNVLNIFSCLGYQLLLAKCFQLFLKDIHVFVIGELFLYRSNRISVVYSLVYRYSLVVIPSVRRYCFQIR